MIVGAELEPNAQALLFIENTRERLAGLMYQKNPFIKQKRRNDKLLILVKIDNLIKFPILRYVALITFGVTVVFQAWFMLFVFMFVYMLLKFESSQFMFIMLWLGLKRAKYKGKLRRLTSDEIVEEFT